VSRREGAALPRNIEIKARLRDAAAVRRRAEDLADGPPEVIPQTDTFFHAPHGRLKLRELESGAGELIHYQRPDAVGPKESRYTIVRVNPADPLRRALADALGVRCVVRKTRTLLMAGPTRIHLDQVEGLGAFLELEVVLRPEQDAAEGERIAGDLMLRLGIQVEDLVAGAYADLLMSGSTG
jgi:adenylate cyclase class IV